MDFSHIVAIAICIFLLVVWGIFWGSFIDNMMSGKGYTESWFWRGFFLGPFIYFHVLYKPQNDDLANTPYDENDTTSRLFNNNSTYNKMDDDSEVK